MTRYSSGEVGKVSKRRLAALLVLLLIFLYLPVMAGYARVPERWTPEEVAGFVGGILRYWVEVVSRVSEEVAKTLWEQLKRQGSTSKR